MVVIEPWRMPSCSWITLTTGARQLVVHDAAVTMRCCAGSYRPSLTPMTTFSAPASFTGALTTTRLTPCSRYCCSTATVFILPLASMTRSQPDQSVSAIALLALTFTRWPLMTRQSPSALASCCQRPCTESNLSRCAWAAASPAGSLICTKSSSGQSQAARRARRPMRPKPLMPTFMLMDDSLLK